MVDDLHSVIPLHVDCATWQLGHVMCQCCLLGRRISVHQAEGVVTDEVTIVTVQGHHLCRLVEEWGKCAYLNCGCLFLAGFGLLGLEYVVYVTVRIFGFRILLCSKAETSGHVVYRGRA